MQDVFNPLTLMIPSSFVMAFAGIAMAGAYLFRRGQRSLFWWSVASLTDAAAVAIMIYGHVTNLVWAPAVGGAMVTFASALHWVAIRHFSRRRAFMPVAAASLIVPPTAAAFASIIGLDSGYLTMAANFAVTSIFYYACAWEIWSTREEKLALRWAMVGFLALHGFVFSGGLYDALTGVFVADLPPSLFSWFGLIHFESLIFTTGATTALLILLRERSSNLAIQSAGIDPLTGTPNRKTLLEQGERLYQRCRHDGTSLSIVMFDLDHFKMVNDTLGHEAGDKVISGFAATLGSTLRPNDQFARYGGEEFIAILPNVSGQASLAIAERVRMVFAEAYRFVDGYPINATVSGGVAEANRFVSLEAAIRAADIALYSAKNAGRNSVRRAGDEEGDTHENIVRIA